MKPIHYGVIGLGPVGTTIAAHLKKAGCKVSLLCANRHTFKAYKENEVVIGGALQAHVQFEDLYLEMPRFVDANPDVIIIATKTFDLQDLLESLKQSGLSDKTVLVSCQNGLDIENLIISIFGQKQALRMVLNLGCSFVGNTEIKVNFFYPNILSVRPEVDADFTKAVASDLSRAGYQTQAREDYRLEVFKKVILNSSLGSVCALTGMTMKAAMEEPEMFRIVKQIIREGVLVAQAMGLPLQSSYLDDAIAYLSKGGDHKPSILMDLEQGNPTENEFHCGKIFEYAQKYNVEVAVTQTLYYLLKNKERTIIETKRKEEGL